MRTLTIMSGIERYEKMRLEFPGLPAEIKVPRGAVNFANWVIGRFYEPNNPELRVPEQETVLGKLGNRFRSPEYCYGFIGGYSGPAIVGRVKELDQVLTLMIGYDISRMLGTELVKLLIAKRFAESPTADDEEAKSVLSTLDSFVKQAWDNTMF